MTNAMIPADCPSKDPVVDPALEATDFNESNFDDEHQKQLARLAQFEDVMKQRALLQEAIEGVQEQQCYVDEEQMEIETLEAEAAKMKKELDKIRNKYDTLKDSLAEKKSMIEGTIFNKEDALGFWNGNCEDLVNLKADCDLTKKNIAQLFKIHIQFLEHQALLEDKLRDLEGLKTYHTVVLESFQGITLFCEEQRTKCRIAESTWCSVYARSSEDSNPTDQKFEIHRLRNIVNDNQKQIQDQKKQKAELKAKGAIEKAAEDKKAYLPLALHGTNIRNRFLESLKSKAQRDEAIMERGNCSAHQGSAIADALLYDTESLEVRTDFLYFQSIYGYTPAMVLRNRCHSNFIQLLDWDGSVQGFCSTRHVEL